MFKNYDEFLAAISNSNNFESFLKNYFDKTNDAISLAIDAAKVGLSSAEIFYLVKEVKPDVLTKANGVVSFLASWNDVRQIKNNLEKGEKITDGLILNTASDFSALAGSLMVMALAENSDNPATLALAAGAFVVSAAAGSLAIIAGDSTYLSDNSTRSPFTNDEREEIAKMVNAGISYEQARQNIYDKRDFKLKEIQKETEKNFEILKAKVVENAKYLPELKSEIASNTANAYKDKQYTDFATALKYFNEDGSVNFAQFLADTKNIRLYDPIALDLNNNGKIDTITLENGVFFDHNGDEIAFKSSWISGDDGILARDINGDKEINSGAELFGNFTQLKNGELAKNGFEALKDLDSDDNGVFDESDKAFNEILVWQDYNSNGKAENGELKSLSEHGIKSINLKFSTDNTALDKDNKQILVGSFAINDSDNALASDIDFSVNTVEREMAESAGLIKGTGFVRDLADALVLSANSDNALVDIYNEFASLDEKQKQLKILPKLVNEWAKTSKHYKSINDDESFLQQNKINIVNIRSDVSTSYVNSLKSNDKVAINQELENTNNANIQSLTPSGLNKLLNQRNIDQDLLKQVLELKDKYSVLQAFSGKDIQTLYYDSNEDLLNIKANITKSYQAILDYTYKSSLMQTRLKEYANDLKLLVDTNMQDDSLKTLIDYSDALNKLENKAKDNLKEAFIDLIEFSDVFDDLSSLKQANDLVSKLINQAIDNNEIIMS
ncbi:hypothetical protein [Campylobacter magnus]|uniref:Uncharacterized protein n=1 Tax=Campylobacter magnus TaxID=3026462 RepID=A0ABT8T7B2_9BACT|nr:hypothetical protein [Campylobacter magnus]MDO2409401.1 hypothetical protein [Campylobacter magnus]